jgi:hypothetical protein
MKLQSIGAGPRNTVRLASSRQVESSLNINNRQPNGSLSKVQLGGRACGFVIKRSLSVCLSAHRLRSTHSCRTGATMNLFVATACMTHTITPPSLMMTIPHPVVAIHAARVAAPHTQHVAEVGEILFPSTLNVAFIQPPGLGAPKASQANPGGAGNAVRCCLLSRALAVALL